jgi:hypothetical protein
MFLVPRRRVGKEMVMALSIPPRLAMGLVRNIEDKEKDEITALYLGR